VTFTRRTALTSVAASLAMPALVRAQSRERDIVIGAPNPLSGGFSEIGASGLRGAQLAIDEINRGGGIKALRGARLKLVSADTSSDNSMQAIATARRLIEQEGAVALLGAGVGTMTLAVQGEAEKAEIPLVTNASADGIVNRGFRYSFKIAPQGGKLWPWTVSSAVGIIGDVKGHAPRNALFVMGNDAVGATLLEHLPAYARTLGLTPVTQSFQTGASEASAVVAAAQRARPDVVFLGGFPADVVLIVKALRVGGVNAPIFGAGLTGTDAVGRGLGELADRIFTPMAWTWDLNVPGNKELVAAYKAAHPEQPFPPANEQLGQGYVIGAIVGQALEQAASRDPKKLREALATTDFVGLPYVSPRVRFGDTGLNVHNGAVLAEWIKGELRTVWPKEQQTTQPVL
jgi:branched-chain amino acid transport system substrate-binding protein